MTQTHHEDERLSAYLDDQLAVDARRQVDAHLRACARCRRELSVLRGVDAQLAQVDAPKPPESYWQSFAARVDARLETRRAPLPWHTRLVGWFVPAGHFSWARAAAVAASVTLLAYVGLWGPRPWSSHENGSTDPRLVPRPRGVGQERSPSQPLLSEVAEVDRPTPGAIPPPRTPAAPPSLHEGRLAQSAPRERVTSPGGDDAALESAPRPATLARLQPVPETLKKEKISRREIGLADASERSTSEPESVASPRAQGLEEVADLAAPDTRTAHEGKSTASALRRLSTPETEAVAEAEAQLIVGENERIHDAVRHFVAAALAGDREVAERARASLRNSAAGAQVELGHMDTWLQETPSHRVQSGSAPSAGAATSAPATLRALDALVWPRRDAAAFRDHVARLADELERFAPQHPELRPRLRAYLETLAASATSESERALWQRRLDALQP